MERMEREGRRGKRWGGRARLEEMPSGKQDDDVSSNANADNKVTYDDEGDKDDGNDDDDGDNGTNWAPIPTYSIFIKS